jgi:hypothetical protein
MTSIIDQINADHNKKEISLLELQNALDKGLLKDKNDIKTFAESMKLQQKELFTSCANSLKKAFDVLKNKPQKTLAIPEVKIMLLYYRIVEGKDEAFEVPASSYAVDLSNITLSKKEQEEYLDKVKSLYLEWQRNSIVEVIDSQTYKQLTKFVEYSSALQIYLEWRKKDLPMPVEWANNTTGLSGKEYKDAYTKYQLDDAKITGAIKALQEIISQAQEYAANPLQFQETFMQGDEKQNKDALNQYLQQQRFDINNKVVSGIEDIRIFQAYNNNQKTSGLNAPLSWFADMNTDTDTLYADLYARNPDNIFETTMSDVIAEKTIKGLKQTPELHDAQTGIELPSEWNIWTWSVSINLLANFLDCADSGHEYWKQSTLLQTMGVDGIEKSPLYGFDDMYTFAEGGLNDAKDRAPRIARGNSIKKQLLLSMKKSIKLPETADSKVRAVLEWVDDSPYLQKNEVILCNQIFTANPKLQSFFEQYENAYKQVSTEMLMQYRAEVYGNLPAYKERTFSMLWQQKLLAFLWTNGIKTLTASQQKTVQDICQRYGESGRAYDITTWSPVFSQVDCDAITKEFGIECTINQLTWNEKWQDIYNYLETNKMMLLAHIAQEKMPRWNMAALFNVLEENTLGMPKPKWDLSHVELLNTFNKIEGIGSYVSDKNIAFASNLAVTIATQVALCYVSWWLANLGTKTLMYGWARLMAASEAKVLLSASEKVLAYYADAKSLSTMARIGVWTADLVVWWSLFHGFSSILSGHTEDLASLEWYLHSIAYFGIMKAFNIPRWVNSEKAMVALKQAKIGESMMRRWLDLPLEILGMAWTDQVINIVFQGEPIDINNPEYWINLVGMVLGLRFAHSKIGWFQKWEKIIVEKMGVTLDSVRIRIEWTNQDEALRQQLQKISSTTGLAKEKITAVDDKGLPIEKLTTDLTSKDLATIIPDLENINAERAKEDARLEKAIKTNDEEAVLEIIEEDASQINKTKSALAKIVEKGIAKTKEGMLSVAKLLLTITHLGHRIHEAKHILWWIKGVIDKKSTKYERVSHLIEAFADSISILYNSSHFFDAVMWILHGSVWGLISMNLRSSLNFAVDYTTNLMKNEAEQIKFYGKNIQIFEEWNSERGSTKNTIEKTDPKYRWLLLQEIYSEKIARLYVSGAEDAWFASKRAAIKESIVADPSPSNMQKLQDLIQSLDPHKTLLQKLTARTSAAAQNASLRAWPDAWHQMLWENLTH